LPRSHGAGRGRVHRHAGHPVELVVALGRGGRQEPAGERRPATSEQRRSVAARRRRPRRIALTSRLA
jgi:hypothetical protein